MVVLSLAAQLYGPYKEDGAKALHSLLGSLTKELEVSMSMLPVDRDGWVDLDLSGEDVEVARALITREVGVRPRSLDDLVPLEPLKAKVKRYSPNEGLRMDVGLRHPRVAEFIIPDKVLSSQIPYGVRIERRRIAELWCLHEHLPLEIQVTRRGQMSTALEAELTERQVQAFDEWAETALDRVIVLGATLGKVRSALRSSRHLLDAARLDRLGLLEASVLCKLGTDAPGIIHEAGRFLPRIPLYNFQPRRIVEPVRPGYRATPDRSS